MADTASVVKGVAALQDELEKTRDRLRGVDETIKKLTGRDPSENRPAQRRIVRTPDISRGVELGRGRERIFALARYGVDNDRGPPAKRQVVQSAFGRLGPHLGFNRPGPRRDRDSGDEDDLPRKVTLHSSVVVTPKETRTRTDTLAAQNEDATGKARNRRMFGLLLGTLQRFRDDEKLKVEKEEKRKAVELKVEERAKQDKENLRRERQNLFNKRKAEQAHMRAIQHKMELVEIHEEWEVQTKQLMKFIRTKTTPHIFYLPKVPSPATDSKLKDTHDALQEIITERRKQLEEEIDEVTCHDADTMEAGDTNHTTGDSVVKTVDTRRGSEGASVGGHSDRVDPVEKDSDNEEARSSSDEGESRGAGPQGAGPQGDGPDRKWENSNGDSIGDDKGAHLGEDAGKQESSSDSESGEDEKQVAGDEPSKERDTGDKEKEDTHRDKEEAHVDKEEDKEEEHRDKDGHSGDEEGADKEDSHQHKEEKNIDKEDTHKDKEDQHKDKEDKPKDKEDTQVDKEERHKHREDKHKDKEVKHRDKEERRRDKEDRRRDKEDRRRDKDDKHKDKEDKHRDKDGSHRHHSHKSSRDSRKVKDSSRKRAHSESEGDSDDAHDRRRRTSESLSEKTKAVKPARRGSREISNEGDNATKKEGGGDKEKAAGGEGEEKVEARTAVRKEEAMED